MDVKLNQSVMLKLSKLEANKGQIEGLPKNPRIIKDDKFKKLVKSIKDNPEMTSLREILVYPHEGKYVVIGGNMRLKAMKELGYKEAPCKVIPEEATVEQLKAYTIKDNSGFGEWDFDMLNSEWDLELLSDCAIDLPEIEIEEEQKEVQEDDFSEEEANQAESRVQRGDIWRLGEHRLMCGDSTDAECVKALMGGQMADMVFTDPPYGVSYTGGMQFKDGVVENKNRKMILNDDKDIYYDVFKILSIFCKGPCYIWFADTKAKTLYEAATKFGELHSLIIWVKNGGYGALSANYKQKHEPCLYWKPKGAKLNFCGKTTETTIWEINKDGKNEYHPTQKPIALPAKAIQNHICNSVLDLFGGSGSTLMACEQLKKQCFAMELDPQYCDVIIARWEKLTGKTAEKIIN